MAEVGKQGMRSQDRSTAALSEDLVWEILVRLPAKDLLRCRAVCRAWHSRTSAADFLLAHHRRQPSLLLVSSSDGEANVDAAFDALDLGRRPTERQPVFRCRSVHGNRDRFHMKASCDGLILLSLSDFSTFGIGRLYLCNPATHQWIALPRLGDASIAGMYSHSPTGEYRVLYWKKEHPRQPGTTFTAVYYVLTVGSAEPRCIGQPIAPQSVQSFVELGPTSLSIFWKPPVLLHDCLHWIRMNGCKLGEIVVFHTVNESFRMMRVPPAARGLHGLWHLLEMDGTLAISWGTESERVLKLWVLQDYETEAWSLKYQIEFPMLRIKCGIVEKDPGAFRGMVVSKDGEALVHCTRPGYSPLFHLDSKGNILQTLQWDGVLLHQTVFRFKENLLKHAFFEGPREGSPWTEPQFFVGLSCKKRFRPAQLPPSGKSWCC